VKTGITPPISDPQILQRAGGKKKTLQIARYLKVTDLRELVWRAGANLC
jgi:hypothetical protein